MINIYQQYCDQKRQEVSENYKEYNETAYHQFIKSKEESIKFSKLLKKPTNRNTQHYRFLADKNKYSNDDDNVVKTRESFSSESEEEELQSAVTKNKNEKDKFIMQYHDYIMKTPGHSDIFPLKSKPLPVNRYLVKVHQNDDKTVYKEYIQNDNSTPGPGQYEINSKQLKSQQRQKNDLNQKNQLYTSAAITIQDQDFDNRTIDFSDQFNKTSKSHYGSNHHYEKILHQSAFGIYNNYRQTRKNLENLTHHSQVSKQLMEKSYEAFLLIKDEKKESIPTYFQVSDFGPPCTAYNPQLPKSRMNIKIGSSKRCLVDKYKQYMPSPQCYDVNYNQILDQSKIKIKIQGRKELYLDKREQINPNKFKKLTSLAFRR